MLSSDSKQVIDILRKLTGDDDVYKIVEADEVLEQLADGTEMSKVQLSAIIKDLRDREYIKVKYFTPDEYCLITLKRAEEIQKIVEGVSAAAESAQTNKPNERISYDRRKKGSSDTKGFRAGAVFWFALLGGMLGGGIVAAIAILIQKFMF